MAEKNYYWLKLMKDFFTKPKIKKLRRIAGGDTYTIIYLKMQLLSLDNEAIIKFENIEDTIEEEIALTIDEDVENVTVTLNYLLSQGLIEKISNNEYLLTETIKLIGSETSVAKRVRKYREKQKALQCNVDVTNCNIEIDIEKDKELDIEKDKDINTKSKLIEEFETLWSMYPNKKGKKKALDHYIKCRKRKENPVSYEIVEQGLYNYNFFIKKNKVQNKFIKHGSTWFNQECWNDDYTVVKDDEEKSVLDMLQEIGQEYDLLGGIDNE